ncbi:cupin domain-containing protein [Nocardioides dongxiaopingii]|uniref:cupin domain-containing protein n=1 Tax=Nocardioides sp. S-1144 TaxID=2582905 RepID=UPI001C9E4FEF|nr:cupin domain-containing protein [Nocardioides sp. S-1144]
MHRKPRDLTTMVLDWGSIKWFVSPDTVPGATSSFGEVVINPTQGHDRHEHPGADEVLYVIEGTGRQTVGDGPEFEIVAGDTIWVPRGTPHSTFNTGWKALRLIATYTPGGEEQALRGLPDFVELPAGDTPVWKPADSAR